MKKITKLLALTLAVVVLATVLVGCSLTGIDLARYRGQVAITVGDQPVTVGTIADLYTSNYYNYYSYISSGQITVEQVFSITMDTIYSTYSKLDSYKNSADADKYTNEQRDNLANNITNVEYLNLREVQFALSYVGYSLYGILDGYVEGYIKTEVGTLAKDDHGHDDERAFTELDDMYGLSSYAEKLFYDNTRNEEVDEYFEKYYAFDGFDKYAFGVDQYVYATDKATAKVENLNERLKQYVIDEEGEQEDDYEFPTIDATQYIAWQNKAIKDFTKRTYDSYKLTPLEYSNVQVSSLVNSVIAAKWDMQVAMQVEENDELEQTLSNRYASNKDAFTASTNVNPDSYLSFIGSLSATSYIYSIPQLYKDSFIFVKNLLIPFSANQTTYLKNLANTLGGTDSTEYISARTKLAADIVAKDFNDDESEVEGLFALNNSTNKIELAGSLATALPNDGTVTKQGFADMMLQYNTDTAQHTAAYEYVVYIGADNNNYTQPWVEEFVTAAKEAYQGGIGKYGIAVSEHGVHIVYYSSPVEVWSEYDFDKRLETDSLEYRFFKTYYTDQLAIYTKKATEDLDNGYRYGEKIVVSRGLKSMLKELGMTYDYEKAFTKDED